MKKTLELLKQIESLNGQIKKGAAGYNAKLPQTDVSTQDTKIIDEQIAGLTELRKTTTVGTAISFKLKEQIDELNYNLTNPVAPKLIVDEQSKFRAMNNIAATPYSSTSGRGGGGRFEMQTLASGGMVKPKYFSVGGAARGTDIVPAMLTPGEFVMSKYAVSSYGTDKMKAINSGTYEGEKVYNYNLSVNVKSDSNPDDIARVVIKQIQQLDNQRIRKQAN